MGYKNPLDERARASRRKHYYANKQQYYDRNRKKEESLRRFLDAVKNYPCTDCGVRYHPFVMDLDHGSEEVKFKNVSALIKYGSWTKLIEEILKCELVCSNCHRYRTFKRLYGFNIKDVLLLT
jgi:hypothetical protein